MSQRIKIRYRWQTPDDPALAADTLAIGVAQILRAALFRASSETAVALGQATKVTNHKQTQKLKRIRALQEELSRLCSDINTDTLDKADSP